MLKLLSQLSLCIYKYIYVYIYTLWWRAQSLCLLLCRCYWPAHSVARLGLYAGRLCAWLTLLLSCGPRLFVVVGVWQVTILYKYEKWLYINQSHIGTMPGCAIAQRMCLSHMLKVLLICMHSSLRVYEWCLVACYIAHGLNDITLKSTVSVIIIITNIVIHSQMSRKFVRTSIK